MIKKLWINNFRNLSENILEFSFNKNIFIYGKNNQGKTNFLESIYVLGNISSPFEITLKEIINFQAIESILGADIVDKNGDINRLYLKFNKTGKKFFLKNNKPLKTYRHISEILTIEYLSADCIRIFQDNPTYRRKRLDKFISKIDSFYAENLKKYEKIIKQRNNILKKEQSINNLELWNMQLIKYAGIIVEKRLNFINRIYLKLTELINNNFSQFKDLISINYIYKSLDIGQFSSDFYQKELLKKINNNFEKEIILKHTLYGPHRDDFEILINDKKINDFYSKGINRIFAILWAISELSILEEINQGFPVMLLDDTFAELDIDMKIKLSKIFEEKNQIFYTSVLESDRALFNNLDVYHMKEGRLYRE